MLYIQQGGKKNLLIRVKSWKIDCIDCSVFGGPPGISSPTIMLDVNEYIGMRWQKFFQNTRLSQKITIELLASITSEIVN